MKTARVNINDLKKVISKKMTVDEYMNKHLVSIPSSVRKKDCPASKKR